MGDITAFNDQLWLAGGTNGSHIFADVWSSPDGVHWEQRTAQGPFLGRTGAALVGIPSGLLLMGGRQYADLSNPFLSYPMHDVWYSAEGAEWVRLTGAAPWSARWGMSVQWTGSEVLLVGGMDAFGRAVSDVWSSSNGSAWSQVVPTAPWPGRAFACSAVDPAGGMWLLGGADVATGTVYGDVWVSHTGGRSWSATKTGSVRPGSTSSDSAADDTFAPPEPPGGDDASVFVAPADPATWAPRSNFGCEWYQGELWVGPGLGPRGHLTAAARTGTSTAPVTDDSATSGTSTSGGSGGGLEGGLWRSADGRGWVQVTPALPWGARYNYGLVRSTSTTISGQAFLFLVGGAAWREGGAPLHMTADVWSSTLNLLCQAQGAVCFRHGSCSVPGSQAVDVPPFVPGATCACSRGWLPPRCNVTECGAHNCDHGHCLPPGQVLNTTGTRCACDAGWEGGACATPQCLDGCQHGFCRLPGQCICDLGWAGRKCRVRASFLQDLGQWITRNLGTVFTSVVSGGSFLVFLQAAFVNCWLRRPGLAHKEFVTSSTAPASRWGWAAGREGTASLLHSGASTPLGAQAAGRGGGSRPPSYGSFQAPAEKRRRRRGGGKAPLDTPRTPSSRPSWLASGWGGSLDQEGGSGSGGGGASSDGGGVTAQDSSVWRGPASPAPPPPGALEVGMGPPRTPDRPRRWSAVLAASPTSPPARRGGGGPTATGLAAGLPSAAATGPPSAVRRVWARQALDGRRGGVWGGETPPLSSPATATQHRGSAEWEGAALHDPWASGGRTGGSGASRLDVSLASVASTVQGGGEPGQTTPPPAQASPTAQLGDMSFY